MEKIEQISFLSKMFFNNTLYDYLISFGVIILLSFGCFYAKKYGKKYLEKIAKKTKNHYDDLLVASIENIPNYFIIFFSVYIGILNLKLSDNVSYILNHLLLVLLTYEIILLAQRILKFFSEKFSERKDSSTKIAYQAIEKLAVLIL